MSTAWGKTDASGARHALAAHCMDVAAVFERLLSDPVLRARAEEAAGQELDDKDITRLSALVFLHDLGKLHPGFQAKGWADSSAWRRPPVGHVEAGGGLLQRAHADAANPLNGIVTEALRWGAAVPELLMAILAHHGRPVQPGWERPGDWPVLEGYDWRDGARELCQMMDVAFPPSAPAAAPLPGSPRLVHLVAGLAALADWIGSDRRFFDFVAEPEETYPDRARAQADAALRAVGVDTSALAPRETTFEAVSGFTAPTPAQRAVAEADLTERLVVLEAETGSGKTEAALWRYARLHAAGAVSGLYFAVPTRAAARQLHARVDAAMRRLFGPDAPEAVLAIPGMRVAGAATGQALPGFETRWDDGLERGAARWAAEHATRFLAATVAVGTVDQAMLSALEVKHAHLRGSTLSRSLLVIDEVHASDAYMTEILDALLEGHLAVGGHALLMSATLGCAARARYLRTGLPRAEEAAGAPYPAVWTSAASAPIAAEGSRREKCVAMEVRHGMAPGIAAREALTAAAAGARVLVIRNTVAAAAETFRAVRSMGGDDALMQLAGGAALHHSRFAAEDRARLDAAVEAVLAPDPDRAPKGSLVVGTQTLEQSLDIDADILVTDLCPVDVLLQRLGRLHRHALPRPGGAEAPRAIVLCPEDGLDRLARSAFETGLGVWKTADGTVHGIYSDLPAIELTRREIATRPDWRLPAMNRELVERVTHPDRRAALVEEKGGDWVAYERDLGGSLAAARQLGRMGRLRRDRPFPDRFHGDDETIMTRLGEAGPVLELEAGSIGPFGGEIRRIALPAHWARGLSIPETPVPVRAEDGGLGFEVDGRRFRYGRDGLDRDDHECP